MAWRAGTRNDGTDSVAEEVAPASHWPQMRALILVVSSEKKGTASTAGMQLTVQTSSLFKTRAYEIVPLRMEQMEKAIQERDFPTFAELTMRDSNSFHATCLDSYPPIHYLNDVSRAAMRLVENINTAAGGSICAYTFDAGPNAVIYYLDKDSSGVAGAFRSILANVKGWDGSYGTGIEARSATGLDARAVTTLKAGVDSVICTGVGGAPEMVQDHLIDEKGCSGSELISRIP